MIRAPFTEAQVQALNAYQGDGRFHEFTCPEDHGEKSRVLVAHAGGWRCPSCDYVQDWAHEYMTVRSPRIVTKDGLINDPLYVGSPVSKAIDAVIAAWGEEMAVAADGGYVIDGAVPRAQATKKVTINGRVRHFKIDIAMTTD